MKWSEELEDREEDEVKRMNMWEISDLFIRVIVGLTDPSPRP